MIILQSAYGPQTAQAAEGKFIQLCVGQAEVDGGGGRAPVDLGEFVVGPGEADLESFDFAEPAFAFGVGDAGDQVVADFGNALALSGIGPVHAAT